MALHHRMLDMFVWFHKVTHTGRWTQSYGLVHLFILVQKPMLCCDNVCVCVCVCVCIRLYVCVVAREGGGV